MSLPELYKTTIIIWSRYDGDKVQLSDLAYQAEEGDAYCSKQSSVLIPQPDTDPDWPGTEFFEQQDDSGQPEQEGENDHDQHQNYLD
jgi:hypothetical protein